MNLGIKPALHQQYLFPEKIVIQKMLSLLNTQTTNLQRIYEGMQQDNLRLSNQVQDLTRELYSTIAVRTPPTRSPIETVPTVHGAAYPRVAAAAAETQVPRQTVPAPQPIQNMTLTSMNFHPPPRPAVTDIQFPTTSPPSITTIAATNITGPKARHGRLSTEGDK